MAAATPTTESEPIGNSDAREAAPITVQYVVLRKDLWAEKGWPLGSIVAQACHASSAAMWENKEDPDTMSYCSPSNIDRMHKVSQHEARVHVSK